MEFFDSDHSHGLLKNLSSDAYASELILFNNTPLSLSSVATYYGYVISGSPSLTHQNNTYHLTPGMYFSTPHSLKLTGQAKVLIMARLQHHGFFQLGGPVEETGRLKYIDGCTDSLLIAPIIMGDPCLNLLHIPKQTEQSQHTHPSHRLGVVINGEGICKTPSGIHPLKAGTIFYIPENGLHSFHTQDDQLRVIAYHPESDFGPTHENHPMINKTIL